MSKFTDSLSFVKDYPATYISYQNNVKPTININELDKLKTEFEAQFEYYYDQFGNLSIRQIEKKNKEEIPTEFPNIPPQGHRLLNKGEMIKREDFFFSYAKNVWFPVERWGYIFTNQWGESISRKILEINYSEEEKNRIINFLKKERAFNADSAIHITNEHDFSICEQLKEKQEIKCINCRFWIES